MFVWVLVTCKNNEEALHDARILLTEADEWFRNNGLHLNSKRSQAVVCTIK